MVIRPFFRWLFKLNKQYDNIREPLRFVVFIAPITIVAIVGGLISFLDDGGLVGLIGTTMMPLCVALMGVFRMPVFCINKNWVNTYIVGWPYRFKHKVRIKYTFSDNRKEITEWTSEHFRFYRGVFLPINVFVNGNATFYFANESDAMAFKLRWT